MKNYKFTIKGQEYEVDILNDEGDCVELEVNGTKYKVEIERKFKKTKTPTLVRSVVPLPSRKETKIKKNISIKATQIKAPLPGTILKINKVAGDTVKKGETLMIMEAMKMENNILSEKDGTIKSIKVNVNDTVLQNDVLLELE